MTWIVAPDAYQYGPLIPKEAPTPSYIQSLKDGNDKDKTGDDDIDDIDIDDDIDDANEEGPVLWRRVAAQVHWETRVEAVIPLRSSRWLGDILKPDKILQISFQYWPSSILQLTFLCYPLHQKRHQDWGPDCKV